MPLIPDAFEWLIVIGIAMPLLLLWVVALFDISRRSDLSTARKVLWSVIVVIGIFIGTAIYFLARPVALPRGKDISNTVQRSSGIVNDLEDLRDRHSAGEMHKESYLDQKRRLLGVE